MCVNVCKKRHERAGIGGRGQPGHWPAGTGRTGAPPSVPAGTGRPRESQPVDAGKSAGRSTPVHAGHDHSTRGRAGDLATGIAAGRRTTAAATLAAEHLGAYARAAVGWLEGRYLTLRPSFSTPGGIYSYITTIRWVDAAGHLGYAESQRLDAGFEQAGTVSMPHRSGHIYLVTNEAAQYRLMMLGRPSVDGTLYGVLSTLEVGHGSQLVPVACPVALMRLEHMDDPAIGHIAEGTPRHAQYRATLDRAISHDYARFHR